MNQREQAEYRKQLVNEIQDFVQMASDESPWLEYVKEIPDFFDSLVSLSRDSRLSSRERLIVRRCIKYLVSPLDLFPEFIYGPRGYKEDLYLIARLVEKMEANGKSEVLEKYSLSPENVTFLEITDQVGEDPDIAGFTEQLSILLDEDAVAGDQALAAEDVELKDFTASANVEDTAGDHTMVFAGPGTGKTFRLREELKDLLIGQEISPSDILVTTFTNQAADELRVRIRQNLMDQMKRAEVERILQELTVSTIHSFCYDLISRFHHHIFFLKGALSPIDETRRMLFMFRNGYWELGLKDLYNEWKSKQYEKSGYSPVGLFHFYSYVTEVYDFLSEEVMTERRNNDLRRRYLRILKSGGETLDEKIISTYPKYWRRLQEEGYLDYSMVLAYTEALLDDPQVRKRAQKQYRHVLVDEYQDTNPIQDRIFRDIVGENGRIFAVADDDQSIYAFRGADYRNAVNFEERWPGVTIEKKEQNYRSTRSVVRACRTLIEHNEDRVDKDFFSENNEGEPPLLIEGGDDERPTRLAEYLKELKHSGTIEQWNDVALLFRAINSQSRTYRKTLREHDIPVEHVGDRRFLKRPIIKGMIQILEMIQGSTEIKATKRNFTKFFRAVGFENKDRMLETVKQWRTAFQNGEYESLLDLFYTILSETEALAHAEIMSDLGHMSNFLAEAEAQIRSPELEARLDWFLSYADSVNASFEAPSGQARDAVQMMTIHKSKGLEFSVVGIPEVNKDTLPGDYPLDTRSRLRSELTGEEPWLDKTEEERRVLYVGMSRAKQFIVLTADNENPSPFLDEFEADTVTPDEPLSGRIPTDFHIGPEPEPMPNMRASHSQIYNYSFCPKRYLLENEYGFAGQAIQPLHRGKSLHRSIEILHRLHRDGEEAPDRDRLEQIFRRSWIAPRDTGEKEEEFEEVFEVFQTYANWVEEQTGTINILDPERHFFVPLENGILSGKIDLVRERNGNAEIVEFKYHENPMLPNYAEQQLNHYSLAFPDESPDLVVHYLQEDRFETVEREDVGSIRAEVNEVFERIQNRHFEADPEEKKCRICPVRFACSDRAV